MFFVLNVGGFVMMQNMMQGIQQRIDHRAAGHLGARGAGCAVVDRRRLVVSTTARERVFGTGNRCCLSRERKEPLS